MEVIFPLECTVQVSVNFPSLLPTIKIVTLLIIISLSLVSLRSALSCTHAQCVQSSPYPLIVSHLFILLELPSLFFTLDAVINQIWSFWILGFFLPWKKLWTLHHWYLIYTSILLTFTTTTLAAANWLIGVGKWHCRICLSLAICTPKFSDLENVSLKSLLFLQL